LDAVEVAAEGEVVHALPAAAALAVQIDGDDACPLAPADGKVAHRPGPGIDDQICLDTAHAGRDIFRLHPLLGNDVAAVDVAHLAIVNDTVGAAVARFQKG